jgi:phosphoglucosamine mutase
VLKCGADLGLAFDGDGDRLTMVDHCGEEVDGDETLFIIAKAWHAKRKLKSKTVVGTKMTNLGARQAFAKLNIKFIEADVGDRYVMEEIKSNKAILGGEGSGHIICLNKSTAGDGIISALQVLEVMCKSDKTLHELKSEMKKYPQTLINVKTNGKLDLENHSDLDKAIKAVNSGLGKNGRVLIRPSGTEPLVRVMVECDDVELANKSAKQLVKALKS